MRNDANQDTTNPGGPSAPGSTAATSVVNTSSLSTSPGLTPSSSASDSLATTETKPPPDDLVKAVREGDVDTVRLLVRSQLSAKVKQKYNYKEAFVEAAGSGFTEIVSEILDSTGVELRGACSGALQAAVVGAYADVCSLLFEKCKEILNVSLMLAKSKEVMSVLLHNNADINETSELGWTALHHCHRSEVLTSLLLRCGADANLRNAYGKTALHLATEAGDHDVTSLLARTTADVNAQTNFSWGGYTALHIACGALAYPSTSRRPGLISQRATVRMVSTLLNAGANVNLLNARKVTPLGFATRADDAQLFTLLLENGADFDMKNIRADFRGVNIRHLLVLPPNPNARNESKSIRDLLLAARFGQEDEVREVLESGISVNARMDTTPLEEAVNSGFVSVIKYLLDHGADVNGQHDGDTPFHVAAQSPKVTLEIVELLLQKGGSINARNHIGRTPLHYAASERPIEIVKFFVSNGAELDATDDVGLVPLHCAALEGAREAARLLVESGTNLHAKIKRNGWSTLHCAAVGGAPDLVVLLLKKGQDVNGRAADGWTPLHCVAWQCSSKRYADEVASVLIERGADISAKIKEGSTALHLAAMHGSASVVSRLLSMGADFQERDHLERTALHCAAWRGNAEVVCKLIEEGADIHALCKRLQTPLLWCATNFTPEAVSMFLEKGANPNDKNDKGWTLLHWASRRGIYKIVSVLLEKGANVNARNDDGQTPLHCAYTGSKYSSHVISLLDDKADLSIDDDVDWRGLFEFDRPYKFTICLLLRHGADKLAEDKDGNSPTSMVETAKRRVTDVVKVPPELASKRK